MATSLLGAAAGMLVSALCACSPTEPGSDPVPEVPPAASPAPAYPVTRVPGDLGTWPGQAVAGLPRSFPATDAALPSVLDDPPGRARLA